MNIKKTLILVLIALSACKKSTQTPVTTQTLSLNGKYVAFRKLDSTFTYGPSNYLAYDIVSQSVHGDTAYLNAGTSKLIVQPNPISNYNGTYALADTLNFTGATTGYTSESGGTLPFTYSVASKSFNDQPNSGYITSLLILDPYTLEILSIEKDGSQIINTQAVYYKKIL